MSTTFNMDDMGLLQELNRLGRRFDETTSHAAWGKVLNRDGPVSVCQSFKADEQLSRMTEDVFGNTAWATSLLAATVVPDERLARICRGFISDCANMVRTYGISVWLYDLINDAAVAMSIRRPTERMPPLIRLCEGDELARRCRPDAGKRYGGRKKRESDMDEHLHQMYRLGAYVMLRWGGDEPRSEAIARMMLADGGLGMCMLKEDAKVMAMGPSPDMRYRRLIDYFGELRAEADAEYDRAEHPHVDELAGRIRRCFMNDLMADDRYLYDAGKLIEAYTALWDTGTMPLEQLRDDVEFRRSKPDCTLWKNPMYLRELAVSLMGVNGSIDLVQGFEQRDRERFERGREHLEKLKETVVRHGVKMLPPIMVIMGKAWPDDMEAASNVERTGMLRGYWRCGDDAATMALSRLTYDDAVGKAALAILRCDIDGYAEAFSMNGSAEPDRDAGEERDGEPAAMSVF
ncbi:hypothetical protein KIH75_04120 [Bifidobacterium sp. 64T4]|uniref:hypothetical protein n=1 Tax=Bifidobacterium pongonis TaxID=2834432 RepID=UPI001C560C6E|nr:hypothetical protein [Bifidobacterium pongonis]MBW3094544.1 hypothetical protein [Bifidobacterium pongonis]